MRKTTTTATIIIMGEESKKVSFDGEAAASLVKELRGSFNSGTARSYEWRVLQVKALLKMLDENEEQIIDALRSDLAKPPLETVVYEVRIVNFTIYFLLLQSFPFNIC